MKANLLVPSLAGLAVALAAPGASAQTVISRSISAQPVETTVTQTPTGTIVTRRPVEGQMVQPTLVQPSIVPPATVLPAPMAVESDTIDAITTREVVRRAEATPRARDDHAAGVGAAGSAHHAHAAPDGA